MISFKLIIFYWSYLVFPFILYLFYTIYKIIKRWDVLKWKKQNFFVFIFLILSIIFIDARFIEPNLVLVNKTQINLWFKTKVVLISDLHLWFFEWSHFLENIVNKINKLDVEYVFIAWDLTYIFDEEKDLYKLLLPLKDIDKEVYFVLWNHDIWIPWLDIRKDLVSTLKELWINVLNNEAIKLKDFYLLWLWDNWGDEDDISLIDNFSETDNLIVMTHNPDTITRINNKVPDLVLCWHTHWWQIRLPFLYKKVIPTIWSFDKWLSIEKWKELFITWWLWIIWLPFRFLNPPVIDILDIN